MTSKIVTQKVGHILHINFPYSLPIHISMGMSDIEILYMEICTGRLYGKSTWSICRK